MCIIDLVEAIIWQKARSIMNLFAKLFCRVYQGCFYMAMPLLPYREPEKYSNIEDIEKIFTKLGVKSALLVTDKVMAESDSVSKLKSIAQSSGINLNVYDGVKPNPTVKNALETKKLYTAGNCQCMIAFGGGSAMDCAKAAGALLAYPKKNFDKLKGLLKIMRKLPPIVAIPTTAGTGSEVTPTAVITDDATRRKYTMNSFPLIPHYAILDPKVTFTLPKHLTATTGMDALTHAVEAYIGNSTTGETRAYAEEAVSLIFKNIKTAYDNPANYESRANMLRASYIAGIAFSKSYVGYIHAVAHSLGGQYDIPHGLANSVLLPLVLKMYGSAIHKKLKKLSIAAGRASVNDSADSAANNFIRAIEELNASIGIPQTLDGIEEKDIPILAKHASKEGNPLYPVPTLMDAKALEEIYRNVSERK